jgi:hypothetical protein
MSDNYQAIYDAVRSRISGGNIGEVVRDVAYQAFDISHSQAMVRDQFMAVTWEMQRPAVLFRPSVYPDDAQWCALYGADIMSGVCGFGETPEAAMDDFDKNWHAQRTPDAVRMAKADNARGICVCQPDKH